MTTTPGRCECNAHKDAEPPQPPPELHPNGNALVYAQAARWAISERG